MASSERLNRFIKEQVRWVAFSLQQTTSEPGIKAFTGAAVSSSIVLTNWSEWSIFPTMLTAAVSYSLYIDSWNRALRPATLSKTSQPTIKTALRI